MDNTELSKTLIDNVMNIIHDAECVYRVYLDANNKQTDCVVDAFHDLWLKIYTKSKQDGNGIDLPF